MRSVLNDVRQPYQNACEEFYRELCRIGACLKKAALERPDKFKAYR